MKKENRRAFARGLKQAERRRHRSSGYRPVNMTAIHKAPSTIWTEPDSKIVERGFFHRLFTFFQKTFFSKKAI